MSRYSAGTNSFTVTDIDALREALRDLPVEVHEADENEAYLESLDPDGEWPAEMPQQKSEPCDFFDGVAAFLVEGEVALFYLCGYDSVFCRPVGQTIAINRQGERRSIDVTDIETLALEIGSNVTPFS